jgi:hypothetical protein
MFGAQGLWAGRDLYRATPVTRYLGFSGLIWRTTPFSRLLRHTRGCGGSILTWILTGPYKWYDLDLWPWKTIGLFNSPRWLNMTSCNSISWSLRLVLSYRLHPAYKERTVRQTNRWCNTVTHHVSLVIWILDILPVYGLIFPVKVYILPNLLAR